MQIKGFVIKLSAYNVDYGIVWGYLINIRQSGRSETSAGHTVASRAGSRCQLLMERRKFAGAEMQSKPSVSVEFCVSLAVMASNLLHNVSVKW